VNHTPTEDSPRESAQEYDSQVAHTIWELERRVRRGRTSDATRRALLSAHVDQMRMIEERAGVPEVGRSFALLQNRVAPGALLIPREGEACEHLEPLGRALQRRGFNVLASSLSYRVLGQPTRSPQYWQTCLDEAENRYDMLNHYASRLSIVGVGLGAAIALHLATRKRVHAIVAMFPTLDASIGLNERLRALMRRVFPRLLASPPGWEMQRRMAADDARSKAPRLTVPILAVAEDRRDGEAGRSARAARKLEARQVAQVELVPRGRSAVPSELPETTIDNVVEFLRRR
jgi:dienelactone hydrolase